MRLWLNVQEVRMVVVITYRMAGQNIYNNESVDYEKSQYGDYVTSIREPQLVALKGTKYFKIVESVGSSGGKIRVNKLTAQQAFEYIISKYRDVDEYPLKMALSDLKNCRAAKVIVSHAGSVKII